jgi:hypothetical protein
MPNELYTRKEVAEIFKVRQRTIWHWEAKGLITPDFYINTRPRYSLKSVEKLAEEKQRLATTPKQSGNKIKMAQKRIVATIQNKR